MKPLPVIPPPAPERPEGTSHTAPLVADAARTEELKPKILDAIRTVFDPEIPVNILELGLIYDVIVDASGVAGIRMTLTAPGCPAAQALPVEVADKAKSVPGDHRRQGGRGLGAGLDQGPDVRRREAATRDVVTRLYAATLQES